MQSQTVKKSIFLSNAIMILVTLAALALVNVAAVKIQWEFIERDWQTSMETLTDGADVEQLLKDWTVHQRSFYVLATADIALCAALMLGISLYFTGRLERQLLRAQEKNAAYEKARTEMIAGISHDLRTPLTAVRGTIKALLDGVVTEEDKRKQFLQTAYRRTEDMSTLLNQLFYLSKLETGGQPLALDTVDLKICLQEYTEKKQELLRQEGTEPPTQIRFTVQGGRERYPAKADPEALQRILDNLLENSRKYAGNSFAEKENKMLCIEISLREKKGSWEICFQDNGRGVSEEQLAHIFEEFYRADASRNQKPGNGLGLYIVKSLTEAMGGSVSAASAEGLAVTIELPKEG